MTAYQESPPRVVLPCHCPGPCSGQGGRESRPDCPWAPSPVLCPLLSWRGAAGLFYFDAVLLLSLLLLPRVLGTHVFARSLFIHQYLRDNMSAVPCHILGTRHQPGRQGSYLPEGSRTFFPSCGARRQAVTARQPQVPAAAAPASCTELPWQGLGSLLPRLAPEQWLEPVERREGGRGRKETLVEEGAEAAVWRPESHRVTEDRERVPPGGGGGRRRGQAKAKPRAGRTAGSWVCFSAPR